MPLANGWSDHAGERHAEHAYLFPPGERRRDVEPGPDEFAPHTTGCPVAPLANRVTGRSRNHQANGARRHPW